jgi:hypothetical protein
LITTLLFFNVVGLTRKVKTLIELLLSILLGTLGSLAKRTLPVDWRCSNGRS